MLTVGYELLRQVCWVEPVGHAAAQRTRQHHELMLLWLVLLTLQVRLLLLRVLGEVLVIRLRSLLREWLSPVIWHVLLLLLLLHRLHQR